MKLAKETLHKLELLRVELCYLRDRVGLGHTSTTIANADWNGTASVLRPHVILHTEILNGNTRSDRHAMWFTIVYPKPVSYKLSIEQLDDLLKEAQSPNIVVDAMDTLSQAAASLPEQQRNEVTKALRRIRNLLKVIS